MRFHAFLIALALVATGAAAQSCFIDTEADPKVCNCGPEPSSLKLCSSEFVEVMGGIQVRHTASFSGLTATATVPYLENASTGPSECVTAVVPAFHCAWWEYDFQICMTMQVTEGLIFDHVKVSISVTYQGKRFRCEPAEPLDCAG